MVKNECKSGEDRGKVQGDAKVNRRRADREIGGSEVMFGLGECGIPIILQ